MSKDYSNTSAEVRATSKGGTLVFKVPQEVLDLRAVPSGGITDKELLGFLRSVVAYIEVLCDE